MYVSITGLRLKSIRHAPRFWWHAIHSMRQAQASPGNISAQARTIQGVHHTLSAWIDEPSMRVYLRSGRHLGAMKAFRQIATGSTVGFVAETVPDWPSAREIWLATAKPV